MHDFARGGTERIAIRLARHWVDAGREVTILVGDAAGGTRADVDPRVHVVVLDPTIRRSPISRLALARAMAAKLAAIDPDVVFLPGNFHLWLAPHLSRARTNGAAHTRIVAKLSNPPVPKDVFAPLYRALLRRFRTAVDGIATMNSGLERELHAIVPTVSIRTLHDPMYFDPMYLEGAITPPAPHAADAPFEIVWAGRLEPQKDVTLALDVLQAVRRRTPARLHILGDGAQRRRLEAAIAARGLGDAVAAPGHVAAIDPWLAKADALLVTSHYEGGPAVAVEALAHGVPVVSTDCSHFLRDIMTLPEAGRIVCSRDPERIAEALLAVRDAGPPDAAALRGLTDHLAPEPCARAYLAWFDEIAA